MLQHAGAGAGRRDDVVKLLKRRDHLFGNLPRILSVAGIIGGLAAAGLRARHMHLASGILQQLDGGKADAGAEQIDKAGDEQADARAFGLFVRRLTVCQNQRPFICASKSPACLCMTDMRDWLRKAILPPPIFWHDAGGAALSRAARGLKVEAEDKNAEDAPLSTGSVLGFAANHQRPLALGEVHARPYPLITAPRLLVQVAFMTEAGFAVDHAVLTDLSRASGVAPPDKSARHLVLPSGAGTLRWERHTEFSTYLYEGPLSRDGNGFHEHPFGTGFIAPGTVISGIRLEIHKRPRDLRKFLAAFDPASVCASIVEGGSATIITDFRQDSDGSDPHRHARRRPHTGAHRRAGAAAHRN